MRSSFKQTCSITKYLLKNKICSVKRFPLVLMLEITHNCNLTCEGCGRIQEFKETMDRKMSLDECMHAAEECGAPVVSVTGGEPFLHPGLDKIVNGLIAKKRHVYLCTNGITLGDSLGKFTPSPYLNINVHLDGMADTHDSIVGAKGIFRKATDSIRKAKQLGFTVCTNTTIFKDTNPKEIEELFVYLTDLKIDGLLVSPGFSFEDNSNDVFIQKEEFHRKFSFIYGLSKKYRTMNTPMYMQFLMGERDLECTPWGNPTKNYLGWKGPCYLITDAYHKTFKELMDNTDWDKYGRGKDPRCHNCMVHCGYEPTVVLETGKRLKDIYEMAKWNFS